MRRFASWLIILGVTFGVLGCGSDPNPPGAPAEIKNADGADALKKQFSGSIPKKKQ